MKYISPAVLVIYLLVTNVDSFSIQPRVANQKITSRSKVRVMMEQPEKGASSNNLTTLERQTVDKNEHVSDLKTFTVPPSESQNVINTDMRTEDALAKEEETDKTKQMLQQVKDAGIAGVISYASWEIAFWAISVPVVLVGYYQFTGHWPDLSNGDDIAKLSAEAFAFVNFARFAVPLRIGLALSTTPWVQANIVDRFMNNESNDDKL